MKIVEEIHGNELKYITHVESGDHLNELNCAREYETTMDVIRNFSTNGLAKINIAILV